MKIFGFPRNGVSYNELFYDAMRSQGGEVVAGVFSLRWLLRNVERGDVAHFHWPSFEYRNATAGRSALAFARWLAILVVLRARGVRVFWTAHNLLPHDPAPIPALDVWARHAIIAISSRVFVHGRHAAHKLTRRFPSALPKIVHIPHGNWIGSYRVVRSRREIRERLGVGDTTFAYVFVGGCKRYKNLEGLFAAFRKLDGNVKLLVAGRFDDAAYQSEIESLARRDPRITLHAGWLDDEALGEFMVAADAIVVPYREALTSGIAVLAMSFGRPIVSIATGHMLDIVTAETGILYDMQASEALVQALHSVRSIEFSEATILDHAASYTFDDAARLALEAMR